MVVKKQECRQLLSASNLVRSRNIDERGSSQDRVNFNFQGIVMRTGPFVKFNIHILQLMA